MRHITWIAALALITTASCKKDNKKTEPEQPKPTDTTAKDKTGSDSTKPADGTNPVAPSPDTTTKDPVPANASAPTVTLVSAGSDPKVALRYAPTQGDKDRLDMVMNMGMEMNMGGGSMPMKIPPMTMVMDTEITSATADSFELSANVTSVKIDAKKGDPMGDAMGPELDKMVGMKMISKMTKRGILEKADIQMPPGINPQMMQMMDSMKQSVSQATAPFPDEPVGVGASWKVVSNLENGGMKIIQTANFELVKMDGNKGTLKIKIEQTAPPQEVKQPGMPAGFTTKLDHLATTGTGEMNFDLTRVVPASAKVTMKSDFALTAEGQGQKQQVSMKMDIAMTMKGTKK
jgi:hypothetical protein